MINISKRPPILRGGWGLKSALLYFEPEIPHWVQLLRIEVEEIKKPASGSLTGSQVYWLVRSHGLIEKPKSIG
jgi:hypothetical protein